MSRIRILITILTISAFSLSSLRAEIKVPTPIQGLTPDKMALHLYGKIPVSLYTGTPQIEIPLDTIHDRSLILPMAISYHSGSVKPDTHPGILGLGWSLILGGSITREKNGEIDEYKENGQSYFKMHEIMELAGKSRNSNDSLVRISSELYYNIDTQPDQFNFSCPGGSGFFMMDKDGNWRVNSDKTFKVLGYSTFLQQGQMINKYIEFNPNHVNITSFTLIGEDGSKYIFGEDEAIDWSIDFNSQGTRNWYSTAWHLKTIIHPNGDKIEFIYERDMFNVTFSKSKWVSYVTDEEGSPNFVTPLNYEGREGMLLYPAYLKSVKGESFHIDLGYSTSKSLDYDEEDYEEMIYGKNRNKQGMIYFSTYSDTDRPRDNVKWRKLDFILFSPEKLEPAPYSALKSFAFTYDDKPTSRLFLKKLSFNTFGESDRRVYSMEYNNPEDMPHFLAKKNDLWGYYNGIDDDWNNPESTMMPDSVKCAYGLLSSLTYPTGGKSLLEFESHDFSAVARSGLYGSFAECGTNAMAGGTRIKKIIDVPSDGTQASERLYYYIKNYKKGQPQGISSGILEAYPKLEANVKTAGNSLIWEKSESAVNLISNNYGHHIGYSEATELRSDGSYVTYEFLSHRDSIGRDEAPELSSNSPEMVPVTSNASLRGRAKSVSYFSNENKLIRKISSKFGYLNDSAIWSLFHKSLVYKYSSSSMVTEKYSLYKTYISPIVEKYRITEDYDATAAINTEPLKTELANRYNDKGQLAYQSSISYRQGSQRRKDRSIGYMWETDTKFAAVNMLDRPEAETEFNNGRFLISRNYEYSFTDGVFPYLPYISKVTERGDNYMEQITDRIIEVNDKLQPVIYLGKEDVCHYYLWGKDGLHILADIIIPDTTKINENLIDSAIIPAYSSEQREFFNTVRNAKSGIWINSYTYHSHLGTTSSTDHSGITSYFDYDYLGWMKAIRDNSRKLVWRRRISTYSESNKTE